MKVRTHRLCERAGYLESILPDTVTLPKERFQFFLNKTLLTDFARRILGQLSEQDGDTVKPDSEVVTSEAPPKKPAATPTRAAQTHETGQQMALPQPLS